MAGRRPAPRCPAPAALRGGVPLGSARTVTKTATVSLHGNTYQVDAALTGRRVELVFDPFDLTDIEVRYTDRPTGWRSRTASAATPTPKPDPRHPTRRRHATGIDYLDLIDATHHRRTRRPASTTPPPSHPAPDGTPRHSARRRHRQHRTGREDEATG